MKKSFLIPMIVVVLFLWFSITPIPISATTVLTDPSGDASIQDIVSISGGFDNTNLYLGANFRPGTFNSNNLGFLFGLDTDLNPATPVMPPGFKIPMVGMDYAVWLNTLENRTQAFVSKESGGTRSNIPVSFGANSLSLSIPLSLLGNSDGTANFGLIVGTPDLPSRFIDTDFAPKASGIGGPTSPVPGYIPEPKFPTQKLYGLFLGIQWDDKLRGDIDAQSLYNKFSNLSNWSYGEIIKGVSNTGITDSDIKSAIDRIKGKMKPNDTFIFFASTHGASIVPTLLKPGDETTLTPGDEFLQLQEALIYPPPTFTLTDDKLFSYLSGMNDINKWVILDACRSGGFWGNYNSGDEGDLEKLNKIALFASSTEDKDSYSDPYSSPVGQGFFTEALTEALTLDGSRLKGDQDGNGWVDFLEFFRWVKYFSKVEYMEGTVAYEKDLGDPHIFTMDMWDPVFFKTDDFYGSLSYQPVPEPATMLLLGSGLIGLAGCGRKKFFKK